MVPKAGLEPATCALSTRYSSQLSYLGVKKMVVPVGLEPTTFR